MVPECPKCEGTSVRRLRRAPSIGHRLMYFFGLFPWECLTCQKRFFSARRHSKGLRHPLGEVYVESPKAQTLKPGAEDVLPK